MSCFEQSFSQFQQTAQFFNPDKNIKQNNVLQMPQKIKKREISMPSYYFDDFKAILKQPVKITTNISQRRNTQQLQEKSSLGIPSKSLKQLTQTNNSDYSQIINMISQFNKTSKINQYVLKEKSINITRDSRTNSRCSVVSAQGERKRSIKVNDPYGLINNKIMNKTNSKQFLKQKAQEKLVDKLFSQRSDSVQ